MTVSFERFWPRSVLEASLHGGFIPLRYYLHLESDCFPSVLQYVEVEQQILVANVNHLKGLGLVGIQFFPMNSTRSRKQMVGTCYERYKDNWISPHPKAIPI